MDRIRSTAAVAGLMSVLLLAACAPEPGPSPTVTPSESVAPSPSASPSPTPDTSPSPGTSPSASPQPSASPSASPEAPAEMTAAEAGELCVEKHRDEPIIEGVTKLGEPTAYERSVDPHWYVLFLAENEFGEIYQECILGGPADDPQWSVLSSVSADMVDDAYIETQRTTNPES